MHRIQIERIHDVLCAKVGCQQFFYFTPEALVADLAFYLRGDPGKIQDAYFSAKHEIADRAGDVSLNEIPELQAPPQGIVSVAVNETENTTTEGQEPSGL